MVRPWKLESSVMSTPIQLLIWFVVVIADWIQRDQQAAIVYLRVELKLCKKPASSLLESDARFCAQCGRELPQAAPVQEVAAEALRAEIARLRAELESVEDANRDSVFRIL